MAAKKKKATSKKASSKNSKKLTKTEVEHFKQLLLEKRQELVGNVSEMHDEALKKSRLDASGDLSSMPIHMADVATDNYEQEFALGLMDSERKILTEINDALMRIHNKTYGICEGTNEPISKARLEAKPWAKYSVEYARMVEQGLIETSEEEEE